MVIQFLGAMTSDTSVVVMAGGDVGCLNLRVAEETNCEDSRDHPGPTTGILALRGVACRFHFLCLFHVSSLIYNLIGEITKRI